MDRFENYRYSSGDKRITDFSPVQKREVTPADVAAALAEAENHLREKRAVSGNVPLNSVAASVQPTPPIAQRDGAMTATLPRESIAPSDADEKLTEEVNSKRSSHVQQFRVAFSVDDIPDVEGMKQDDAVADPYERPLPPQTELPLMPTDDVYKEEVPQEEETSKKSSGCVFRIIFVLLIVIVSCALATVISTFLLDVTGSTRNGAEADIVIPNGANTETIATILKKEGLIDNPLYFRIYSRLTGADGKWQVGAFTLQADMGFPTLIETLQISPPRETVTVLLREGLTIDEMAVILDEKGVCSKQDFLDAVMYEEYDYDFLREIPTEAENPDYTYRVYRLEGYLFPDTYNFYVNSLGKTVVDKMLQNFQSKLTDKVLSQIEAKGWTLDQAVTFASMVQGEGDTRENMDKVSRVLHNRLDPKSGYKLLQLCCTRDYANEMANNDHFSGDVLHQAYNTYKREGFPVGPIGNPGLDAILATLKPSEDEEIMKCYFFATDYKTGTTYFSKTMKEHQAIIKKYGIEDLG